jgi:hypothetical protein
VIDVPLGTVVLVGEGHQVIDPHEILGAGLRTLLRVIFFLYIIIYFHEREFSLTRLSEYTPNEKGEYPDYIGRDKEVSSR